MEPTNDERVAAAREALAAWRGPKGYSPGETSDEEDAIDIITDILHMVYEDGGHIDTVVQLATMNVKDERGIL